MLVALALPLSQAVVPGAHWDRVAPESVGLNASLLDRFVGALDSYGKGSSGVVVRYGKLAYTWNGWDQTTEQASAVKPIFASLLVQALTAGTVPSVAQHLTEQGFAVEGKDVNMTWRDVANMVSGYTRAEAPGAAWAYNDFGIELFKEALKAAQGHTPMQQLFDAGFAALQLEDAPTFDNRDRLYISPRDFARLGLLWLREGAWGGSVVLEPQILGQLMRPYVPSATPRTAAPSPRGDYLGIGSFGGTSDQSPHGPGHYGYTWWFNRPVTGGALAWPSAPADVFQCNGCTHMRAIFCSPLIFIALTEKTPGDGLILFRQVVERKGRADAAGP